MSIDNIPKCMNCPYYSESTDWCYNPNKEQYYYHCDFYDHKHGIK